MSLVLHDYIRSSAAYRLRIALNLKELPFLHHDVNLLESAQKSEAYRQVNPQGLVPALETQGQVIAQSMAVLEWLEETHPTPCLLPGNAFERAQIRSVAHAIACDIHPVNNLRVLKYLQGTLECSDEQKTEWYHHWILEGFQGLEAQIQPHAGTFCFGDSATIADVCLVPQMFNAKRFGVDLSAFPTLVQINEHCLALHAFSAASPEQHPNA